MSRKRITQIFPWLLPLRKKQRLFFFYMGMKNDKNKYAEEIWDQVLPYPVYESKSTLYNHETGFDMVYQENKVFNLKLAAKTLNHIVIKPGETFSFWNLVRFADKKTPYKDGLIVIDGILTTAPGGGMCQMSNLLFWMFLHTPLTIVERQGHALKDFPDPPGDTPLGVDATVLEGWKDLKIRNDTNQVYQIALDFDNEHIIGNIYTNVADDLEYGVCNGQVIYKKRDNKVFEEAQVLREVKDTTKGITHLPSLLYSNCCEIGYQLPKGTEIIVEE